MLGSALSDAKERLGFYSNLLLPLVRPSSTLTHRSLSLPLLELELELSLTKMIAVQTRTEWPSLTILTPDRAFHEVPKPNNELKQPWLCRFEAVLQPSSGACSVTPNNDVSIYTFESVIYPVQLTFPSQHGIQPAQYHSR